MAKLNANVKADDLNKDIEALRNAKTSEEVEAIMAKYNEAVEEMKKAKDKPEPKKKTTSKKEPKAIVKPKTTKKTSKEEDTPAARMKGQIRKNIKLKRKKELMLAQQAVVFEKNRSLAGKKMKVIIDGKLGEEGVYIGRTYADAPGIDGCIFVNSERDLISGTIIDVKIDGYHDYDLAGHEV